MASTIKVFYQNTRGLRTKCLQFKHNLLLHNFDIVILTETWLHCGMYDRELCDSRYDVFRRDRDLLISNKSTGGGVMILVKTGLRAELCQHDSNLHVETITVKVPARSVSATADLYVSAVYIPPDLQRIPLDIDCFLTSFDTNFNAKPHGNYLIVGDFNLPQVNWSTSGPTFLRKGGTEVQNAGIRLVTDLALLGMSQQNYIKNYAGNTLDLAFCNLPLLVTSCSSPLVREDRAHPSFTIDISDLTARPLVESFSRRYDYRKGDYSSLSKHFKNIDWPSTLCSGTVDEAIDRFYLVVRNSIEQFVPLIRQGTNRSYPVWYSKALIKTIKEKSKAHSRWKKYGNLLDHDEFVMLRSRQRRLQDSCFKKYTADMEKSIKTTPKKFWSYVKALRGGSNFPDTVTLGNTKYTGGEQICDAFSDYFKSVFGPASTSSPFPCCAFDSNDSVSSLNISTTATLEILTALDHTKGPGSDSIPPLFWKNCAESLAIPITLLFNKSLNERHFPQTWKKALIVPIHKNGSKTKVENYRGISLLNTLSKVFEKLVYRAIYPVIRKGIPNEQHGFLQKRSTISNLTIFTDYLFNAIENGGQVDVIYTDFEKAFDRVDHVILLTKLQELGIHGDLLRWIESYLTNRSQAVVIGGFRSDFIAIPTGVPQGSHLGPLFYNAYIYDISVSIKYSNHLMYADDKKIFLKINDINDCDLLQLDLDNLINYYNKNKISLNVKKCQSISYTRKRNPLNYTYRFDNEPIQKVNLVRDLGVIFDSKLTMTNHIDSITSKAFKNLGFVLRTCKAFNDIEAIKLLYFAYVRSILEYGSPVWSPQFQIYNNALERIQKKFINHLSFRLRISHDDDYFEKCTRHGLLTLKERRGMMDMCLLHDILNGRIDSIELVSGIKFCTPRRRTRHTPLLYSPPHKRKYVKNSVLVRIANTYNKKFCHIDVFHYSKTTFKNHILKSIKETRR